MLSQAGFHHGLLATGAPSRMARVLAPHQRTLTRRPSSASNSISPGLATFLLMDWAPPMHGGPPYPAPAPRLIR